VKEVKHERNKMHRFNIAFLDALSAFLDAFNAFNCAYPLRQKLAKTHTGHLIPHSRVKYNSQSWKMFRLRKAF